MGFQKVRQEGSHVFLQHHDGRTTVVPNHPGEDVDRGLLNKILKKDLGIEREEFMKYIWRRSTFSIELIGVKIFFSYEVLKTCVCRVITQEFAEKNISE